MLTLLEDEITIGQSQRWLEARLWETTTAIDTKIGFQGGSENVRAHWNEALQFWFASKLSEKDKPHYWNSFGLTKPKPGSNSIITCQANVPISGIDRSFGAAFARDENQDTWLIHRGKIGGGRVGIGATLMRFQSNLQWLMMEDSSGDGQMVVPVAKLKSESLVADVADFVFEVARLKSLPALKNSDDQIEVDGSIGVHWWWVNQNKTYKQEREGGFIWAPQKTKGGSEAFHHVNVNRVMRGDVIVHYSNQKIAAVSVAQSNAYSHPKPPELISDEWETDGYRVDVQYFDLIKPIHRDEIPIELRITASAKGKSPFTSGGSVNQGYLFALPDNFVAALVRLFPAVLPDGVEAPLGLGDKQDSHSAFDELRDLLRNLNVNRDYGTTKRYKPAIILSALDRIADGQQSNVFRLEELLSKFKTQLAAFGVKAGRSQAEEAFYRLDRDKIFKYQSKSGGATITSEPSTLKQEVDFAYFPERFWQLLQDSKMRELLRRDILEHWFQQEEAISEPEVPFDRQPALTKLIADIQATGFYFEPWQIAAYVTALRTKPFIILAGVSGSGKSQLPQLVSDLTESESKLVPVRPDWTDSSEILGYTQIHGHLVPGHLLRFAYEAAIATRIQHVCIVDEMNLARVEHYFAEVLSRIEQTRGNNKLIEPLLEHRLVHEDDEKWQSIGLSSNLAIVGTVNMDESTHGFSKKVLDRAFTLEFSEINLEQWESSVEPTDQITSAWPATAWLPRATKLSDLRNLTEAEKAQITEIIAKLVALNEKLAQAQLQLAYRSRDEIVMFVLHAQEVSASFVDRSGNSVDPLDLALQMKVLPRIAGGSETVRRLVLEMLGWSYDGKDFSEPDQADAIVATWTKLRKPLSLPDADYPRTCARLCLMWDRLVSEGFTSFWL